jgi:hypothetical protein
MTPAGLPHSDIPGSKRACRSPRLIAACCVLHRLSVPRHPPSTLSNLTIKCLDLMRSAVETSLQTSRVHLIYNPYSIVKERWIAKIDAEHKHPFFDVCAHRKCSRLAFTVRCCGRPLVGGDGPIAMCHGSAVALGGADRDRTDDPLLAKQVLSQLSYSPRFEGEG